MKTQLQTKELKMNNAQKGMKWFSTLGVILMTGCASTYHDYSGSQVDCQYCDPPPLPYTCYDNCVCHSRQVSGYLESLPHQYEAAESKDNNDEPGK
jgi:hypothetical protein